MEGDSLTPVLERFLALSGIVPARSLCVEFIEPRDLAAPLVDDAVGRDAGGRSPTVQKMELHSCASSRQRLKSAAVAPATK